MGIDLAKRSFHVYAADAHGQRVFSKKLTRARLPGFIAQMPLAEFLAELARYRPGVLRYHPGIAQLRVSGTFSVTDTDLTLAVLQQVLPIRVSSVTPYWISVAAR